MQYFAQSQHRSCAVPILLRMVPTFSNVPIWGQNGTDFACRTAKTLRDFRSGLSQCKFVHKRRQVRYQYVIYISQDFQQPNFTYRQLKIFLKTQRYFKKHYYTWSEQVLNSVAVLPKPVYISNILNTRAFPLDLNLARWIPVHVLRVRKTKCVLVYTLWSAYLPVSYKY